MCILNSCCCFELRTGGLIIGWLGVIGSVLQLFMFTGTHVGIVVGLIGILCYAALLYAIDAKKPIWLMVFIIFSIVGMVLNAIFTVVSLFISGDSPEDNELKVVLLIAWAVSLGFFAFFTTVLYSLYKQMKNDKLNPSVV